MAAISTLIKEINNKINSDSYDNAFKLYSDLLTNISYDWKISIVEKIAEQAKDQGFNFLFSQNLADMLIIDDENLQLLLVWITPSGVPDYTLLDYFQWMESTRKSIEDDTLTNFGYTTKVLHVLNEQDVELLEFLYFETEDYYSAIPDIIDLKKCVPQDSGDVQAEIDDAQDFLDYCTEMASDLAFLETPWPQDNTKKEEPDSSKQVYEFDILETAPDSYKKFLHETRRALSKKEMKEVFGLSLHSVFAGDNISKPDQLTKRFAEVFPSDGKEGSPSFETVFYDFFDISDKKDFSSFLENQEGGIIVLENIEYRLTAAITFKKSDLIRILCKHLDTTNNHIFVLKVSKQGWKELVAEYPLLRVYFQNIFEFENLSVDNLINHFNAELKLNDLSITDEALNLVREFFTFIQKSQKPDLFDFPLSTMLAREAKYFLATRNSQVLAKDIKMITKEDIEKAIKDEYVLQPKDTLKGALAKVEHLIGLNNVKTRIKDLAALVRINKLRNNGQMASTPISLNSLFVGNPGTGKTTVASLLGAVYKSVGALESGHVVAVSRQDIVSQWIGQTEEIMSQHIKKAQGGILFIDEAYALYVEDSEKDFGREAINVLVDRLEAIKDHTCVILAGYPGPMKKFLQANPGLSSRFPQTIAFPDYSVQELNEIFKSFLKAEHFYMDADAESLIKEFIETLILTKDKNFGNARTCRNLFEQLKLVQARRIIYSSDDEDIDLNLFTSDDIKVLLKEMDRSDLSNQKQRLGFKLPNS